MRFTIKDIKIFLTLCALCPFGIGGTPHRVGIFLDMENKQFVLGKLTLLKTFPIEKIGKQYRKKAKYKCFCGNEFVANVHKVKSGHTKSCGCYHKDIFTKIVTKHGESNTRLFRVWTAMLERCFNKNNDAYKNYGGRGITVCEEWKNDYIPFRDWALQNGYKKHLTIDRENNDGNYEPTNCRFVTYKVQSTNRRPSLTTTENLPGVRSLGKQYNARINIDGKRVSCGTFKTAEEAYTAYCAAKEKRDKQYLSEV